MKKAVIVNAIHNIFNLRGTEVVIGINKCQINPMRQSRMENPETLATLGKNETRRQNKINKNTQKTDQKRPALKPRVNEGTREG